MLLTSPVGAASPVLAEALSAAVGAALVLDAELGIALSTKEATALLGFPIPLGASATKVLCKSSPKRVLAQALADGLAIQAMIPHPTDGAKRALKIRALPLGAADKPTGWLLLLDEAAAQSDESVLFHGMWTQTPSM
ncbi:MAG TPA: hypothetical protein VIW29_12360, partial [Polyangiaceae bacterium]